MVYSYEAMRCLTIVELQGTMCPELHREVPQIFGESGGEIPGTKRGYDSISLSLIFLEKFGLISPRRQSKPHR